MITTGTTPDAIRDAMRRKPETITIEEIKDSRTAKRMVRAVQRGRLFIDGGEAFSLSRTKARKLAYRWRGNRRGRKIAAWLVRTTTPVGLTFEDPPEYRIRGAYSLPLVRTEGKNGIRRP